MKIYKLIPLFFSLLLLLSLSYAYENNISLNLSEVDYVVNNITISSLENQTIFFTRVESDDRLILIHPTEIFYNVTEAKNISINISKNSVFLYPEIIDLKFNISNDYNNNTDEYILHVNVTPSKSVIYSEESFMEVVEGESILNISEALIPKKGTFNYTVHGPYNDTLLVDCSVSDWLTCPNESKFNENNKTDLKINWSIPHTATVGDYEFNILFKTSNLTRNSTIRIYITEPAILFQDYDLDETCIININDSKKYIDFDCFVDYKMHTTKQLAEVYEIWREQIKSCEAQVVNQTVMVGSVDDELYTLLQICESERDTCKSESRSLTDDYFNCQENFNEISKDYNKLKNTVLGNESKAYKDAFQYKNDVLNECAFQINESNTKCVKRTRKYTGFNILIWFISGLVVVIIKLIKHIKEKKRFNF